MCESRPVHLSLCFGGAYAAVVKMWKGVCVLTVRGAAQFISVTPASGAERRIWVKLLRNVTEC